MLKFGSSMRFNFNFCLLEPYIMTATTIQAIAAVNQYHKKNNHAQEHKKYLGKPFYTREENPTILCYILKRRSPDHKP